MIIYSKKTPYNDISVEEDYPIRKLLFGMGLAHEQSAIDLTDLDRHVYDYSLLAMDAFSFVKKPSNALIIGLGGGIIARQIVLKFPDANVDILEIDPEVLNVDKEYFFFKDSDQVRVHIGDALETISKLGKKYDVVILDAFDKDYIPPQLMTESFTQQVYNVMSDNSVFGIDICHIHESFNHHLSIIKKIFEDNLFRINGLRNNLSSFIFCRRKKFNLKK